MTDIRVTAGRMARPRTAKSAAGGRRAAFGLLIAVVGGGVTAVTYSNAEPGESYFLWWGPVLFGVFYLIQGLAWMAETPPAGWYLPAGASMRRHWDGYAWTNRTPFSVEHRPDDALAAFTAAGIEADGGRRLTDEEYGDAPRLAVQTARVRIPSLGADKGGRVFAFDDPDDLAATRRYYEDLGRQGPDWESWTFTNGNLLVQLPRFLPESSARRYEEALATLPED